MKCAKEYINGSSARLTRELVALVRKELPIVVGLMTGHCYFGGYLHKIAIADVPTCRWCLEEDETVNHVLRECPALNGLWQRHFEDTVLLSEAVRQV